MANTQFKNWLWLDILKQPREIISAGTLGWF